MWQNIPLVFMVLGTVYGEYKFETKWFDVPLDHFAYQRNETFKIKYLVNDSYWDKSSGPIFFYTGNEGQIEQFARHTGFMWEIAPEFKARLVFAEHRYYGESMPFGKKSLEKENVGYLTSSQALADYADLINYLQQNSFQSPNPVIAFGGSYGGMLAAYIRIKYPHLVAGSIAASAPIHMFTGMVPPEIFNRIVTSSFKIANKNCVENIKKSWKIIRNITSSPNGTEWLRSEWKLCEPIKNSTDVQTLIDWLEEMYGNVAMVNYPFATDFLMPLPANPVRTICQYFSEVLDGKKLLEALGKIIQTALNFNGKRKCVSYNNETAQELSLDTSGWNYQACTEMVMPISTTGVDDMFEPSPWNYTKFADDCHKTYGVYPRPEAAWVKYGGINLQSASNIVFSNGLLDPWAGGGVLFNLNDAVVAVAMIDAAHHLDLMPSHPEEPNSVKDARNIHKQNIAKWIAQYRKKIR